MTRYILGIDGGGTKTQAAIVDQSGRLCGAGRGGPSNYDDVGVAAARENILASVAAARAQANLDARPFDAVFLGMAGVVSPADRAAIHQIARDLDLAATDRIGVDHDCRAALAGALSGRAGIVLIAGTGSSCFGVNWAGESWRAGGWGQLIADEGSGYWLGVEALRAAVRAYDGRGPDTLLLGRTRERLALDDMNEIMHRLYVSGMSRAEIAALAPLVVSAAREMDAVATQLIRQGVSDLADCVLAVARRLGMADAPCELALVGGLFQAHDVVMPLFRAALRERLPACEISACELPPVLGACLLGL
ncbi:MAG TPA: BadF/BadG/BcrA/BcrD ATPase family protein, partial [Roseiflexaceae bacterium]|nr:BadF/BadG/BcrA/BcrD ATPase family protein [Roseiflexaceae bacterium]